MHPLIQPKTATRRLLIMSALVWFGLSPVVQAVSPAPDGCYPGFTTAEGCNALQHLGGGAGNTAVGWRSLFSDVTGNYNTAVGAGALIRNTADSNTAVGAAALLLNTTGTENTAVGTDALVYNDTGSHNTAIGLVALLSNTTGVDNTATGQGALKYNTTANDNTANGINALYSNTTGAENTACGGNALLSNNNGNHNTANGFDALYSNTTGSDNTAIGVDALNSNTTGNNNTAIGYGAGLRQTTGGNNIYIGDLGSAGESNVIRIGAIPANGPNYTDCFIGGIFGNTTPGIPVYIDVNGHLSTTASSARFKDDIKPMANASDSIFALKPVTFRYKKQYDAKGTQQFGLVAEEVAKVNPDLVFLGNDGKPYTVRYEQVNAMLLNEFLKEHRKVEELEANAARQQKEIEMLTAGLQKVSAQLEVSKPAPQTVLNNQ
jgi:hypothetical protein